jgi:hypothetical protein
LSPRFVKDMRAFFKQANQIKQGEIAARQLHALRQHRIPPFTIVKDLLAFNVAAQG